MNNINLLPFNFKKIDNKFLIVNFWGEYFFINKEDFNKLIKKEKIKKEYKNKLYYINKDDLNSCIKNIAKANFF